MTPFYVTIPLMVMAVTVAVLPVLAGSFRHHRSMAEGQLETGTWAVQEADFWHHMLGHRRVEDFAPTRIWSRTARCSGWGSPPTTG